MKQILDQIASSSAELLQCLIKEHQALSLHQVDELLPLSEQKQQLVTTLDQLDQQRKNACNHSDFIAFLNDLDPSLTKDWLLATGIIKKCQQQNDVNGRLLARRNALARETLEIFTGKKLSGPNTYGSDGLQSGQSSFVTNVEA